MADHNYFANLIWQIADRVAFFMISSGYQPPLAKVATQLIVAVNQVYPSPYMTSVTMRPLSRIDPSLGDVRNAALRRIHDSSKNGSVESLRMSCR